MDGLLMDRSAYRLLRFSVESLIAEFNCGGAARLNKIGINICNTCDMKTFSTVFIRDMREINPVKNIAPPAWYKRPNHLQVAA